MIKELFELVWGPIPGTDPSGIAFSEINMFVHGASRSDLNQVIKNLNLAFVLVFCGPIVSATKHYLENVSVDYGIMIEQFLE